MKRLLDIFGSAFGLIVLSPALLVIALLIRLHDGGPALYRGRRVGRHGRLFSIVKFRTMAVDAHLRGGTSTAADDERITAPGRVLRRFKLDELPQLLNVLKGDMSLVGPRPQVEWAVALYSAAERDLLTVRPGMTDYASIRFSNEADILRGSADPDREYLEKIAPEKIRLGLAYVRTRSFAADLRIIAATLWAIAGGDANRVLAARPLGTGGWRLIAGLVAAGLVAVVPRAMMDYGQSGDAIDNARDAMLLAQLGPIDAIPSMVRWPPGIPLFITLLAGVVPWAGHVGSNLLAFAAWAVALILFAAAVRNEAHGTLLVVLFGTTPFLLLNAAVTQDFIFGLAAALAVYLALTRRAYRAAGLLLGIGMSLRVTNALLLLPALAFVWLSEADARARVRAAIWMTALTLSAGLLLYVPFLAVSGLGWRYFVPLAGHGGNPFAGGWRTAVYNWLSVFGFAASLGMLGLLALSGRRIVAAVRRDWRGDRAVLVFAATTIAIYAAVSFRFTMKAEYVMPAIPFMFLLAGRWLDRRQLVAATILVASYAVVALDVKGGVSGRRELTLKPTAGLLVHDWQRRHDLRDLRAGVGALRSLDRAVVLTGMGGMLTYDNDALEPASARDISPRLPAGAAVSEHRGVGTLVHRVRGTSVFVVTGLPRDQVEIVRGDGYGVFMFSEFAPSLLRSSHGYDPYDAGIALLPVFGPDAFYRRTARAALMTRS